MARWTDDDTPRPKFKLQKKHAWILVDLAVIALIFMASSRYYVESRGTKMIERKEAERAASLVENARLIEQADSVAAASQANLADMRMEHGQTIEEVTRMRSDLEIQITRTQQLGQGIFRLSDMVLDLRERTQGAQKSLKQYEKNLRTRSEEIDSLQTKSQTTEERLLATRSERARTAETLRTVRSAEAFDPTGRFPARTGVAVRRDLGDEVKTANLELQQLILERGGMDVGLAVGFGLGTDSDISNKEVGLLLSRPLIHRRLGLDLGAGYSVLTEEDGEDDSDAYASAGLRISPFYKERLHIGLGARASHGEVIPFLGVSLGRR